MKVRKHDRKWIDSRGVKEAHTEPSQHANIQLLVLGFLLTVLAQQRDQTEVKGRQTVGKSSGKMMEEEYWSWKQSHMTSHRKPASLP